MHEKKLLMIFWPFKIFHHAFYCARGSRNPNKCVEIAHVSLSMI